MQTLSIDIETYSDVNLSKCGVYKYAESPDFEILLFGYSADGSEVTVIDLAQGEPLPQEIIDALTDDTVIKWAFNANFERVCLSRYLRDLPLLDYFRDSIRLIWYSSSCAAFFSSRFSRLKSLITVWMATTAQDRTTMQKHPIRMLQRRDEIITVLSIVLRSFRLLTM